MNNQAICIAGIDPGLAATGLGLVRYRGNKIENYAFGCIRTSAKLDIGSRLEIIYNRLSDFIDTYRPDILIVEDVFSLDAYPKSGIILGNVTGVIHLAAAKKKLRIEKISTREAKNGLTGSGAATKQQLELSVRSYLNHKDRITPLHASDALALAIAGMNRYFLSKGSRTVPAMNYGK